MTIFLSHDGSPKLFFGRSNQIDTSWKNTKEPRKKYLALYSVGVPYLLETNLIEAADIRRNVKLFIHRAAKILLKTLDTGDTESLDVCR